MRVAILAQPRHFVPEPVHRRAADLVAVVRQVAVDVVHLGAPSPGLHRAAARHPDRRMRRLDRPRPDVHVALLVEPPVEGERVAIGPGAQDQVVRLVIALAQQRRVLAVGVTGVHRRADRKPGDQPPAGDAVDHCELFGHPRRRIVQRQRVAHHAERGVGRAPRQRGGDQIGRRHQAVAVGMMLVHAYRVEAAFGGVFQFIHEIVVHVMRAPRIEQRRMDVDPDRRMLVAEARRQLGIRHQMEPHQFHFRPPSPVSFHQTTPRAG